MCNFISAIKGKNKAGGDKWYFLTYALIHNTPQGKLIQKKFPGEGELIGHSAIRAYFELREGQGTDWECTDFTTPKNFPAVIVRAIKRGDFRGMATPGGLLTQAAWAECQKVTQPAEAEYQKVTQAAWAEYQKVTQAAWAEYQKVTQAAEAEYQKVTQPAWAEYQKVTQPAEAEYQKVTQAAFWDLFANPENRAPAWHQASSITRSLRIQIQ